MSTASPGPSLLLSAGSALPAGERHRVATGDGGQLHAVAAGSGRPLVLTHGALLSLEALALPWQPLLAADHQAIAPADTAAHLAGRCGVEARGFEPLASSVRVNGGSPLCGAAFA